MTLEPRLFQLLTSTRAAPRAATPAAHRTQRISRLLAGFTSAVLIAACGADAADTRDAQAGPPTTSAARELPPPAHDAPPSAGSKPADDWRVPGFAFHDANGRTVTPAELRGHVWIANFVFTQCTTVCPTLTAKMALLRRRLPQADLRFVSFSVDPAHDDEAALAAYAARFGPPDERWVLCRTDPAGLDTVVRGFRVRVMATDDARNPIVHSNRFFLVDGDGRVISSVDSDDDEACARLVTTVAGLVPPAAGTSGVRTADASGEELFLGLGCMACHADARLAPSIQGLAGAVLPLEGGASVTADAAYVRESILDPHARLAAGYGPTMPSYRAVLDDAACARLVDHVLALGGPARPSTPAAAPAKGHDPICGMTVTVRDTTPKAEYQGKTWWFCCEGCRDEFLADPARYADK